MLPYLFHDVCRDILFDSDLLCQPLDLGFKVQPHGLVKDGVQLCSEEPGAVPDVSENNNNNIKRKQLLMIEAMQCIIIIIIIIINNRNSTRSALFSPLFPPNSIIYYLSSIHISVVTNCL